MSALSRRGRGSSGSTTLSSGSRRHGGMPCDGDGDAAGAPGDRRLGHLFYARTCPACKATVPESAVECPKCSTPLEPMMSTPLSENRWARVYGVSDKTLPKRGRFAADANVGQRGWFG